MRTLISLSIGIPNFRRFPVEQQLPLPLKGSFDAHSSCEESPLKHGP